MKKYKLAFNAKGSFNIASYRIPFIWIKSYLSENYICVSDAIDNSIDIYFCKAGQGIARKIREKIPNAFIVLFKPHLEISTHIEFLKPFKSIRSLVYLFIELIFKKKYKSRLEDINASSVLIADSKKLQLHYQTNTKKKVLYFRILEKLDNLELLNRKGLRKKQQVLFLYFGSITHYNESYPQLQSILRFLSQKKAVKFVCISSLYDLKKKINIKNVDSFYYQYDYQLLMKYLRLADIGYVPHFLRPRINLLNEINKLFNHSLNQLDLYSITEKNSSNAGRAYLYAAFGVPFLSHPTREIVADFSETVELPFPNTTNEAIWLLNKLIVNDDFYLSISQSLQKKSQQLTFENETDNLMKSIIDFVSE